MLQAGLADTYFAKLSHVCLVLQTAIRKMVPVAAAAEVLDTEAGMNSLLA